MPDERITDLIRQGQQAMQRGNRSMANEYFRAATDLDPNNATAWLWLSGTEDDPAAAKRALERVLEIDPNNTRAKQGLREVEQRLSESLPEWNEAGWDEDEHWDLSDDGRVPREGEVPMTIEQELRAALRVEEGASRRQGAAAPGGDEDAPRQGAIRSFLQPGENDQAYRVAVAVLTLMLIAGMVCFVLVWMGVGPFAPRV